MTENTDTQVIPAVPTPAAPPHVKRRFREIAAQEMATIRATADAGIAWWQAALERVEAEVPDPAPYRIGQPPYTPTTTDTPSGRTP
ncbi:hypothetical protein [Acrocarpospora catenulata]|uniref:hypothetical protein n=1 Tax=Acrocarpospora catenulata TaxID=2836182 RepID=UPI001BD9CD59|nr:hypothetical protein [Acrocarpospora catenulata]